MAFVGLKIEHATARLLHEIEVPGDKTDSGQFHITLLYFENSPSIDILAQAMIATFQVSQKTAPFIVKTNTVNYFPVEENQPYPIIAPIISKPLHLLHSRLKRSFDKLGIEYSKKYKNYSPHISLSFNSEPVKKTKIEPIEWSIQELVIYGSKDGDSRISINFPLTLHKNCKPIECKIE